MDANPSAVATSSDETLFLSSTGDVLVCRDFDHQGDRCVKLNIERIDITNDIGRLHDELEDCQLLESNSKDKALRNLWGQPHQSQDDEFSCCDVNTSCHSNGLCGGAESSSSNQHSHSNSMNTNAKQKRVRTLNSKISLSATNTKRERGVAYINSSDSSGRKGLSINTYRSEDEEYDNVDINGVNIRDHDQWITVGTNSPTPVMSFDYSCYEPPTPESSRSYDREEEKHFTSSRVSMNGHGNKSISMPNLSNRVESDHLKDARNLANESTEPFHKQTFESHAIHPRTQQKNSEEKHSSHGAISNQNSFPGIPTFFGYLSQIRITQISAHPTGYHVLLISDEGMLFSYGSNDRGQLGLGRQHTKVTAPQLITPLLENGGKTINCAAGLDYSLVVVKTEGSRIAHRRRQRSPNSTMLNERNAHQQVYAFGCNDNNKLGLLDPNKPLSYSAASPRRRWRKDMGDSSPIESPEPPSPSSFVSTPDSDSTNNGSANASTDVYLPRRVALHCKVIPKRDSPETSIHNNRSVTASIPYGIFCIAASKDHSAALVKRPSGSVEVYTWGRGEDGRLGLPVPGSREPLTPTRRWETLCCASMDNDDETLNSLIDDGSSLGFIDSNQSALAPYFVPKPSMVTSISMQASKKSEHPPLPTKNKMLHRPRTTQRSSPSKYDSNCMLIDTEHVVTLALGPCCTHVVTSTGQWFAFGSSSDGLLASGGHASNIYQPTEVKLPLAFGHEKMSSISIGETHGIALTTTGRAFTWGTSPDGVLGRGNKSYIPIPQPISLRKSTGSAVLNLALTRHLKGESLSPRSKAYTGDGVSADASPVAYVHAGKDMSVFILRSGSIQTCGRRSGRLGQGDVSMCILSPTAIFGGIQMWQGEKSP